MGLAIVLAALGAVTLLPASASANLARLIAPDSACPHQRELGASVKAQEGTMRCMVSYAREASGLTPLAVVPSLARAADSKAGDIIRCEEFSHEACGREFTYWMEHYGYLGSGCWRAAENIAWGTASFASVRAIFRSWIGSKGHRENILGPYAQTGIGLRIGKFESFSGARVWVEEFGSHDC